MTKAVMVEVDGKMEVLTTSPTSWGIGKLKAYLKEYLPYVS